ncbi:hypothetical protein CYMTET_10432 [Cymbomonas tetramitiformis]|uniref:Uncharacterized protein n=1 Tax=Cymbomonas tetramitiformis TaxID=36881 RepID=A0AAE0GP84_9CHLO|nr:hypothetical protein CYMTET_10432 [Cymbomonas tetramitiformis]
MCCLQTAHLQVKGAPGTAKYKMHIDLDPTPWLGRQYTEYERALLEGLAGWMTSIEWSLEEDRAESVSKCFYVLDPENLATEFDRKEPFVLAEEIASQVVIRKHPCMETSMVLDPLADFFEQIVRDENPSDDEA